MMLFAQGRVGDQGCYGFATRLKTNIEEENCNSILNIFNFVLTYSFGELSGV